MKIASRNQVAGDDVVTIGEVVGQRAGGSDMT